MTGLWSTGADLLSTINFWMVLRIGTLLALNFLTLTLKTWTILLTIGVIGAGVMSIGSSVLSGIDPSIGLVI